MEGDLWWLLWQMQGSICAMEAHCSHGKPADQCESCAQCEHDVVLNGACFYCGATEIEADIKGKSELIPASQLTRHRD